METISRVITQVLVVHECPVCGTPHAIPKGKEQAVQKHGDSCYCPNGHAWHVTDTVVSSLSAQLDEARADRKQAKINADHLRKQCQSAWRSLASTRGVVTRLKNKLAKSKARKGKR